MKLLNIAGDIKRRNTLETNLAVSYKVKLVGQLDGTGRKRFDMPMTNTDLIPSTA